MVVNVFYKIILREKILGLLQVLGIFYNVHTRIVKYAEL